MFFGVKYVNILFQAADVLQECYSRFAVPTNFLPSNAKVPHRQVDLQQTTCRHDTLFESSNVVIVSFNLPPFLLAFMQNLHAPFDFFISNYKPCDVSKNVPNVCLSYS